jgi:hypothetical protein
MLHFIEAEAWRVNELVILTIHLAEVTKDVIEVLAIDILPRFPIDAIEVLAIDILPRFPIDAIAILKKSGQNTVLTKSGIFM